MSLKEERIQHLIFNGPQKHRYPHWPSSWMYDELIFFPCCKVNLNCSISCSYNCFGHFLSSHSRISKDWHVCSEMAWLLFSAYPRVSSTAFHVAVGWPLVSSTAFHVVVGWPPYPQRHSTSLSDDPSYPQHRRRMFPDPQRRATRCRISRMSFVRSRPKICAGGVTRVLHLTLQGTACIKMNASFAIQRHKRSETSVIIFFGSCCFGDSISCDEIMFAESEIVMQFFIFMVYLH